MGPDAEDLRAERGRKPSLQSRLQSGQYHTQPLHSVHLDQPSSMFPSCFRGSTRLCFVDY